MSDKALRRPPQVTMAGVLGIAGSLLLVLGLFDAMSLTRTVGARESVGELLTEPLWEGVGLTVDEMIRLIRWGLFALGAAGAVAFVLAIYIFQRNNAARIGFTVAAAAALPGLFGTTGVGFGTVLMATAAVALWSAPARDWFAGRTPGPRPQPVARTTPVTPPVPPQTGAEAPPPSPYPFGTSPHEAYPSAQLSGQLPGQRQAPRNVAIAVLITRVFSTLTVLAILVTMVRMAVGADELRTDVERQIADNGMLTDFGFTSDQLIVGAWVVVVGLLLWAVAALVVSFFVQRGESWARIVLAISSAGTAAISLVTILGVLPVFTLMAAVVTLRLLFTPSANSWFSGR